MTEKPDYVKAFTKPPKTEIKHIGKGWYLYECTSRYDPELKRSRKISGKCLGAITPTGLVQSQRRMQRVDTPRPTRADAYKQLQALLPVKLRQQLHGRIGVREPNLH